MEKKKRVLHGKKTQLKDFKENFTKVPNIILYAKGITPIDKLILIELQSYSLRSNWILAYTRMAADLKIDKSNLIKRWKSLIKRGYILDADRYSINYELLISEEIVNNNVDGSSKLPSSIKSSDSDGGLNLPEQSSFNLPAIVGTNHLDGGSEPPIEEENKEEDKWIKRKRGQDEIEFNQLMQKEFKNVIEYEGESISIEWNPVTLEIISIKSDDDSKPSIEAITIKSNDSNPTNHGVQRNNINSFEDLLILFTVEQLNEMASMSLMNFVKKTDGILFSENQYELQTTIHTILRVRYGLNNIPKAINTVPKANPTVSVYDDLPFN